jgi:hypothetical protein
MEKRWWSAMLDEELDGTRGFSIWHDMVAGFFCYLISSLEEPIWAHSM